MPKHRERCGICGRSKVEGQCLGPHIKQLRRRHKELESNSEPQSSHDVIDLSPRDMYSQALSRRDAGVMSKPVSTRRRSKEFHSSEKSPKHVRRHSATPMCPVCDVPMQLLDETATLLIYRCKLCRLGLSVKRSID
jgi:CRISPR/Cas system-associated protein Cas10 (large subunit of type III CRISPR-Cas system)